MCSANLACVPPLGPLVPYYRNWTVLSVLFPCLHFFFQTLVLIISVAAMPRARHLMVVEWINDLQPFLLLGILILIGPLMYWVLILILCVSKIYYYNLRYTLWYVLYLIVFHDRSDMKSSYFNLQTFWYYVSLFCGYYGLWMYRFMGRNKEIIPSK